MDNLQIISPSDFNFSRAKINAIVFRKNTTDLSSKLANLLIENENVSLLFAFDDSERLFVFKAGDKEGFSFKQNKNNEFKCSSAAMSKCILTKWKLENIFTEMPSVKFEVSETPITHEDVDYYEVFRFNQKK